MLVLSSYILDLRDNGGGLVQAGLDVARLWLDGPQTILHIHGRNEQSVQDVTLEVINPPMVLYVVLATPCLVRQLIIHTGGIQFCRDI